LKKEDLDALPDDPDDLQADLQALAGPAADRVGIRFYIDGFTGGRLPPKESIREIRINSNPFSGSSTSWDMGAFQIFTSRAPNLYGSREMDSLGGRRPPVKPSM